MIDARDLTLSTALAALGYTHDHEFHGRRNVRRDGVVVLTGTAGEVWEWLYATKQCGPRCEIAEAISRRARERDQRELAALRVANGGRS